MRSGLLLSTWQRKTPVSPLASSDRAPEGEVGFGAYASHGGGLGLED